MICHSTYEGADVQDELITLEVEFHRFILPELNTHRVLSRNYQSSRAVPVEKLIEQIRYEPALPVHWGKNQRGMVAEQEVSEEHKVAARAMWENSAKIATTNAQAMLNYGVHKQLVNRLLEPFMWTRGVITATRAGWDSVFALRCHPDAQPEFQALAYKMKEAIEASTPDVLRVGEWHLPYVNCYTKYLFGSDNLVLEETIYFTGELWSEDMEIVSLEDAIKISTSCCAQVSYRQLDDSLEKAIKIYDMLNLPEGGKFKEAPAHMSPCEHQARVESLYDYGQNGDLSGNFGTLFGSVRWQQYRKILEKGLEQDFI